MELAIQRNQCHEVVKRATAISMLHLGYDPEEVAQVQLVGRTTISNWWLRWNANAVEGLANRPKRGRPSKGTTDDWKRLEALLQTDPTGLGDPFTI
ncbi:MAG: helix-turn-helix domain-containing protein [Anaerolineae bacterium]|nr:helix-turn-helix domain-containing protein [Anaerolineae bacterium]